MNIIQIKGLKKDYETDGSVVHAINGIDLVIKKGEFAAIAGPSGSGKTTLLNCIGGLDSPNEGSVAVGSKLLSSMNTKELSDMRLKNIGFIFQAYNLIPVLTALENVEYVLLLQKIGKNERRERSERILLDVGLENELHRVPGEMSGGQQQRVAVARAMVTNPDIILADEPTANLDQATGAALMKLMRSLNMERQVTFLFSTHDRMVMNSAKRLIMLRDGCIASDKKRKK